MWTKIIEKIFRKILEKKLKKETKIDSKKYIFKRSFRHKIAEITVKISKIRIGVLARNWPIMQSYIKITHFPPLSGHFYQVTFQKLAKGYGNFFRVARPSATNATSDFPLDNPIYYHLNI